MSTTTGNDHEQGIAATRLPPLPRRTLDDELGGEGGLTTASPTATVAELLERTNQLLFQLEADIEALQNDQERDKKRIHDEADRREQEANQAVERLQELATRAREIAERKAVTDVLDAALDTPMGLDPTVTFDELVQRIEQELRLAKGITGAIRLEGIGILIEQATLHVAHMAEEATRARAGLIRETEHELTSEGKEARASYEIGMGVVVRDLRMLDLALPPSGLPWDDDRWNRWARWDPLSGASRWIRFGSYYRPKLERIRFPALIELPGERPLAIDVATGDRASAVGAVRSIVARLLASTRGGDVLLSFVDPVGLGDSPAPFLPLGEYRDDLIGPKVHTTEEEIEELLAETGRHIERVIQQHLRGGFDTLDAASEAAGELLEPYRMVAIFDFPNNFTPRALSLLRNITDNGPRCGVLTVATTAVGGARMSGSKWRSMLEPFDVITGSPEGFRFDAGPAGQWNVDLDQLETLSPTGTDGQPTLFGRIISSTGEDARTGRLVEVSHARTFELLQVATRLRTRSDLPDLAHDVSTADPETWWAGDSRRGVGVPIGRCDNREVATIWLDSTEHPGVIIGGEPGSGTTTLLHNVIVGLSLLYSPDELTLHLLDFTPGSGSFATYATESLPHARVVGIDADREFGVSVLDGLVREMTRRAMIIAPHGGERVGIEGYRRETDEALSRVVVVIDGAEQLFGTDDRLTEQAAHLLDVLARQGPSYGIHLVMTTHDMAVLQRLGRHTTDQISGRIAFACPDDESRRILGGDGNASRMDRVGDALRRQLDAATSTPSSIHTVALSNRERDLLLRELRGRSAREGAGNRPHVFEGDAPARLEDGAILSLADNATDQHGRLAPRMWLGEPVTLGPAIEITLRRRAAANLLVVGASTSLTNGLTFSALASAALGHGDDIDIQVVDFVPLEAGFMEAVATLGRHFPISAHRRNALPDVLGRLRALVADRTAKNQFGARPTILVLNGIGAAPEFDLALTKEPGDRAAEHDPVRVLEAITRDGPAVGVHTVIACDTARSIAERLSRTTLRNFAVRAVLSLPASDSLMLIDSAAAETIRDHQALLYDEAAGQLTKFRPYLLPQTAVIDRLGRTARGPKVTMNRQGAVVVTDEAVGESPGVTRLEHSSKTTPVSPPTSALAPNAR